MELIPQEQGIENQILDIRGQKVILDVDLARLYGVETKRLNQQVKRNLERFPIDFVFRLTEDEMLSLKLQNATSNRGGRRTLPYAFTEHGAIMAASVLNTPKAVETSIYIVRAFIKMRTYFAQHKELADKVNELEAKIGKHDALIVNIVTAIKQLMEPPKPQKKEIGFKV
ncbi:ORF6N domain-containing protein [Candidatus Cloacimonadota bacterium]